MVYYNKLWVVAYSIFYFEEKEAKKKNLYMLKRVVIIIKKKRESALRNYDYTKIVALIVIAIIVT
jgi:hypothetical protein